MICIKSDWLSADCMRSQLRNSDKQCIIESYSLFGLQKNRPVQPYAVPCHCTEIRT